MTHKVKNPILIYFAFSMSQGLVVHEIENEKTDFMTQQMKKSDTLLGAVDSVNVQIEGRSAFGSSRSMQC